MENQAVQVSLALMAGTELKAEEVSEVPEALLVKTVNQVVSVHQVGEEMVKPVSQVLLVTKVSLVHQVSKV